MLAPMLRSEFPYNNCIANCGCSHWKYHYESGIQISRSFAGNVSEMSKIAFKSTLYIFEGDE